MRVAVVSHKPCWRSPASPSGFATDGGFPFQIAALSELFDATVLLVPCNGFGVQHGETPVIGRNLSVVPLTSLRGADLARKARMPLWTARNARRLLRTLKAADAVHALIPGDVGTVGFLLALALRKPLFVRYCGNWFAQRTLAEHVWRRLMESVAGGANVIMATGGHQQRPSARTQNIRWIFSTSLRDAELERCATTGGRHHGGRARLVIACRQDEEKGTRLVIDSLPFIASQLPNVSLDVVGDGRTMVALRERARALDVADRVTFHGAVDHDAVLRVLRQSDLFCFPTSSEGFPKVVLEALACGLPVVTTKVSVLPDLLADGGGILLDERTPRAIAAAVVRCLADPARYRAMSEHAMKIAKQFSLERWRDAIGEELQSRWGRLSSHA